MEILVKFEIPDAWLLSAKRTPAGIVGPMIKIAPRGFGGAELSWQIVEPSVIWPVDQAAEIFATSAHAAIDQRRKYTNDPYIVHPAAVVAILRSVNADATSRAAAWLHDVVEDTQVTLLNIIEQFGMEVANLVWWLTDTFIPEPGMTRAERKANYRFHLAAAPAAAKTIKLADLIDNTFTIVQHDKKFAKVYLAEKAELLEVLRDGDARLWERAKQLLDDGLATLVGMEGKL